MVLLASQKLRFRSFCALRTGEQQLPGVISLAIVESIEEMSSKVGFNPGQGLSKVLWDPTAE